MAIEAPLSRYKRSNFRIWFAFLIALAMIFAYDGYLSKYPWSKRRPFYEEHHRVHLFNIDSSLAETLEQGPVSEALRGTFEKAQTSLSSEAVVSVKEPGAQWDVTNGSDTYTIVKEENGLGVYVIEPDGIMLFNMISPIVFLAVAAGMTVSYLRCKNDKVVAEETELVIAGKERIPYDAIEKIDKTHFDRKGFFTIFYKSDGRPEVSRRLSDRQYDNLKAILDHLVAQIT